MERSPLRELLSWLMALIIALAFITTGWPMIVPSTSVESKFIQWGYDSGFATIIGVSQIIAGILVLIPRTAMLGAVMVVIIMGGAIYTHIATAIGSPAFAVVLLLMAVALFFLRWNQSVFLARMRKQENSRIADS